MKLINSYIFRAICAILVGFMLIANPERMTAFLVQIIGGLFALSGLFSLLNYFIALRDKSLPVRPVFPIIGLGSLLFGIFLAVFPALFITYLMYVLGGLLLIAGVNQIATMAKFQKYVYNPWWYYIIPTCIALSGVFILFNPLESASVPFIILGATSLVYGLAEFINGIRLHRMQRNMSRMEGNR